MISHPNLLTSHEVDAPTLDSENIGSWVVDGVQTTGWHFYSGNHMWLEIDQDANCHIGIDPFFARVVDGVDRVTFVSTPGRHQPSAVITVKGVDLSVVFPNSMNIIATNSHLRVDPNRIATDPYTLGWLFEGVECKPSSDAKIKDGLISGEAARAWMQNETSRLSEFVHERFLGGSQDSLVADGGTAGGGLTGNLNKEQILLLYNEFFLPRS
jgi:glycine cleavage system H lipoate-binding protein